MIPRLLIPGLLFVALFAAFACGGEGEKDDTILTSELGQQLEGPPPRYAPAVEELPGYFIVDRANSFNLSALTFASLGPFATLADGDRLAAAWGYEGGYIVVFQPDGLVAGVLEGRFFATVMIHQFETAEGAREAFAHYEAWSDGREGSEQEPSPDLGNEASAWSFVAGKVGNTNMEAIFHRVVMRRGNVIADIVTQGGQPFMTINDAVALAQIIDERAEGVREAVPPTPVAVATSPAF